MPRAAKSVATTTRIRDALKSSKTWVRLPWLSWPCKGSASIPALRSLSATISAEYFVATNTKARLQPECCNKCRKSWVRTRGSTAIARWVMSGAEPAWGNTLMRNGVCNRLCARALTAGAKVAEKNRFWRLEGSNATTRCSSSLKPASSMRSASSNTRVRTAPKAKALWSTKSNSLPGVATTISVPRRKPIICGLIDTPPNTTVILRGCGKDCASPLKTSPT